MLANTVNQIAIAIAIAAVVVVARCQNGLEEKQKMTTFPRRGACSKGDVHGALHRCGEIHATRSTLHRVRSDNAMAFFVFFSNSAG